MLVVNKKVCGHVQPLVLRPLIIFVRSKWIIIINVVHFLKNVV